MNNKKKIAKIAVIILIVSALSLFFTQGKALAYGTWQGSESSGMPQKKRCYLDMEVYYQI